MKGLWQSRIVCILQIQQHMSMLKEEMIGLTKFGKCGGWWMQLEMLVRWFGHLGNIWLLTK
jgi:hypothetical protein